MRAMIGAAMLLALTGCQRGMALQPKYSKLVPSKLFADGASAQREPAGTVERDEPLEDEPYNEGRQGGLDIARMPVELTPELVARGRERFDIYCAVCHGRDGDGKGVAVQRGFPAPPSYHTDRLHNAPDGQFFNVITNGLGNMSSYDDKVKVKDRWAIIAYIRALQLSRQVPVDELSPEERRQVEEGSDE